MAGVRAAGCRPLGAAIGAKLLSDDQLGKLQDKIADQAPGLSDLLDLDNLVEHAGSVGLIAVGLVAIGSSVFANSAVGWAADKAGIEGGAGRTLLFFAGLAIALVVDFLLLVYLLTRLPRVHPGRRAVVVAGLIGAVGFELLKWLLTGYLQGVAAKSMYGAFAVPVAVVLWINLMARLLLYCAAWTATQPTPHHSGRQPAAVHQQHRASRSTARDPSVVLRARAAACGHRLGNSVRPPGRGGVRSRR